MKFIVIVVLVAGLLVAACSSPKERTPSVSSQVVASLVKSTGSTGPGDVLIELTPHAVSGGQFVVDVSANTHSVSLSDYALVELTELQFGDTVVVPLSGPELSGHHASGTLVFETDPGDVYQIVITGFPNVEKRVYRWGDEQ